MHLCLSNIQVRFLHLVAKRMYKCAPLASPRLCMLQHPRAAVNQDFLQSLTILLMMH